MFTGIVNEIGKIVRIENKNQKKYLTISCKTLQSDLQIGESIACNGICLTVIRFTSQNITVETMNQTLKTTTAGKWKVNTSIHLEKALALNGRLNGHLVQGHIDTIATLNRRFYDGSTLYLEFKLPTNLLVDHGSICIDGVSLTIAKLSDVGFQVALIEHTLSLTHLGKLKSGDEVNIEFDIIGKYVQKMMMSTIVKHAFGSQEDKPQKKNITEDWLKKEGF